MAAYFLEASHEVIVVDNLLRGYKEAVLPRIRFIESDINDLANVLSKADDIEAIVHLAIFAAVGESMAHPYMYWRKIQKSS